MKNKPRTQYTLQYGSARKQHGSSDGYVTICGKRADYQRWWRITNNTSNGDITCADCLRKMKTEAAPERREGEK